MTSEKKTKTSPPQKKTKRSPRKERPSLTAAQKVQAVLAVWTDKAKPADVCRQLQINWVTFHQWQKRAMEAMLQALEPRVNLSEGLSPRLQQLIQKQQRHSALNQLTQRLEKLPKPELAKSTEEKPKME